jgi:hypothetical protein
MLLLNETPLNLHRMYNGWFDDFDHVVTADRWTTIVADGNAAVTVPDGSPSIASLAVTDATDNDECYLHTTSEQFKMVDNLPIVIEARLQYSEAATDDANILFGLLDTAAANHLQDDGAGPLASYNGACFFKVDGGTRWQAESSITTTQTTTDTKYTAGGASFQTLRIEISNLGATKMDVAFWIANSGNQDFEQCRETGKRNLIHESHQITLGTAVDMDVVLGVKNGGATAETLDVDYVAVYQKRFV